MTVYSKEPRGWLDTFVGHAFLSMVSDKGSDKEAIEKIMERCAAYGGYDLRVTANDVQLDFDVFLKKIESQMDRMIVEKAGELLKSKLGDLLFEFEEVAQEFGTGLKREAAKLLGYDPWERER
jgi:hypothetical protein